MKPMSDRNLETLGNLIRLGSVRAAHMDKLMSVTQSASYLQRLVDKGYASKLKSHGTTYFKATQEGTEAHRIKSHGREFSIGLERGNSTTSLAKLFQQHGIWKNEI